jgi:hypothetical protein
MGFFAPVAAAPASLAVANAVILLGNGPGAKAFTVMRFLVISFARILVRWITAALDAE